MRMVQSQSIECTEERTTFIIPFTWTDISRYSVIDNCQRCELTYVRTFILNAYIYTYYPGLYRTQNNLRVFIDLICNPNLFSR